MSTVSGENIVGWLPEIVVQGTDWEVKFLPTNTDSPENCMGFEHSGGEVSWTMPEEVREALNYQAGSWYDSEPLTYRESAAEDSIRYMIQVPTSPQYDSYKKVIGHLEDLDKRLKENVMHGPTAAAANGSNIAGFVREQPPCSALESHLFALMSKSGRPTGPGWLNRTLRKLVMLKFFDAAMGTNIAEEAEGGNINPEMYGTIIYIFKELLTVIYGEEDAVNLRGYDTLNDWRYIPVSSNPDLNAVRPRDTAAAIPG